MGGALNLVKLCNVESMPLRLHLDSLKDQNIITKSRQPVKGRGRPRFTYSVAFRRG